MVADNPPNDPNKTNPPAGNPPPDNKGTQDTVALAKRVGELEAVAKEYEGYKQKVDPVLETLYTDPELLKKATEVHNRRLGKTPKNNLPPNDGKNKDVVSSDPKQTQIRNSQINIINERFEEKVGINKLEADKQKEIRGMVGMMVKEMLDPNNNKTIDQVFEDVNVAKLPWYLERAYDLVSKSDRIKEAEKRGEARVKEQYSEEAGLIGSIPSGGSSATGETVLSVKERAVAAKMGVSEEDYLKQKKAILDRRDSE